MRGINRLVSWIALLIAAATLSTVSQAADVASRVEAVTVYPSGASVTRVASVSLSAGTNVLQFSDLVSDIDATRIRVEVVDNAVQIGQIQLGTTQRRDAFDADVVELQRKIEQQTELMSEVSAATEAAKLQLKFLDGIATGYAKDAGYEGTRGTADPASWQAALRLLMDASKEANATIRANNSTHREYLKDLSVLQRELQLLQGGALASTSVSLTVNSPQALQTNIRLHYFQESAYWQPRYEARLDSNSGELQLAQQADVFQETDEDWNNVVLTLSTSEPTGELEPPALESEFLNIYKPVQTMARKSTLDDFDFAVPAGSPLEEIAVTGSKRVDVGNFAVNYDVPGRTTVKNDSDEAVTLDLANFAFDVQLVTQVVPRESTQAFLAARFTYDKTLPLYGSDMTVFVDGAFAGYTQMPTALPQAEVVLPMGQDRRIVVSANSQGGKDGNGGIINKRRTEATDYLFEITNRRAVPSIVEVMDLYPVSRNKAIKVDIPRTTTAPDESDVDDRPGLVMWKKTLAAGEEWQIRHQYSVSYPADQVLVEE